MKIIIPANLRNQNIEIEREIQNWCENEKNILLKIYDEATNIFYRVSLINDNRRRYYYFQKINKNNQNICYLVLLKVSDQFNDNIQQIDEQNINTLLRNDQNLEIDIQTYKEVMNDVINFNIQNDENKNLIKIYQLNGFASSIELEIDEQMALPGFEKIYDTIDAKIYEMINDDNNYQVKCSTEYQPTNAAHTYYIFYCYIKNLNTLILCRAEMDINENEKQDIINGIRNGMSDLLTITVPNGEQNNITRTPENNPISEEDIIKNSNLFEATYMEDRLYDKETWRDLLRRIKSGENMFHALSQEEISILNELRSGNGFPAIITGRAGSGKTLMLQYLLSDYIKKSLQEFFDENHPEIPIPIPLYITSSKKLLDTARELVKIKLKHDPNNNVRTKFDNFFSQYEDKIFITYEDFLCKIIKNNNRDFFRRDGRELKIFKFPKFYEWYSGQNNRPVDVYTAWHVIRSYIKGLAVDGQEITPQEFSKISNAVNADVDNRQFELVYNQIYHRYSEYLQKNYFVDEQDLAMEAIKHINNIEELYFAVICDEAQDFTYLDFQLLGRVPLFARRNINPNQKIPIVIAGDPIQTINPSGYDPERMRVFCYVMYEYIYHGTEINYKELTYNYRSAKNIALFNNLIIYKRRSIERDEEIKEQKCWKEESGRISIVDNLNVLTQNNIKYKVFVIYDEKEKTNLENKLRNRNITNIPIFTPQEIKGLQFRSVVVYNFSSFYPNEQNSTLHLKYFFNNLYVATSRAESYLIIIDQNFNNVLDIDDIINKVQNDNLFSINNYNYNDIETEPEITPDDATGMLSYAEQLVNSADDENMPKEKRKNLLDNAKRLYMQIGSEEHRQKIVECEAKIYELENEYSEAAERYLQLEKYDKYIECLWLANRINDINNFNTENRQLSAESQEILIMARLISDRDNILNNIDRIKMSLKQIFPIGDIKIRKIHKNPTIIDITKDMIIEILNDEQNYMEIFNYSNWLSKILSDSEICNQQIRDDIISELKNFFYNKNISETPFGREFINSMKEFFENDPVYYKMKSDLSQDINEKVKNLCECYRKLDDKARISKLLFDTIITNIEQLEFSNEIVETTKALLLSNNNYLEQIDKNGNKYKFLSLLDLESLNEIYQGKPQRLISIMLEIAKDKDLNFLEEVIEFIKNYLKDNLSQQQAEELINTYMDKDKSLRTIYRFINEENFEFIREKLSEEFLNNLKLEFLKIYKETSEPRFKDEVINIAKELFEKKRITAIQLIESIKDFKKEAIDIAEELFKNNKITAIELIESIKGEEEIYKKIIRSDIDLDTKRRVAIIYAKQLGLDDTTDANDVKEKLNRDYFKRLFDDKIDNFRKWYKILSESFEFHFENNDYYVNEEKILEIQIDDYKFEYKNQTIQWAIKKNEEIFYIIIPDAKIVYSPKYPDKIKKESDTKFVIDNKLICEFNKDDKNFKIYVIRPENE